MQRPCRVGHVLGTWGGRDGRDGFAFAPCPAGPAPERSSDSRRLVKKLTKEVVLHEIQIRYVCVRMTAGFGIRIERSPSGNFYSNGRLPITSLSARGATGSVSGSGAGESGETPSGESGAPHAALGLEPCASAQRVPPSAMQSTESPMLTSYIRIDDGLPSGPRAEREGLAAPRRDLREVSTPLPLVHSFTRFLAMQRRATHRPAVRN